ncbi:MAG: AAA family ATPase [Planctomycetota bacterium]
MTEALSDSRLVGLLRRVMRDAKSLYQSCGKTMVQHYPTMLESSGSAESFETLMDDLHRGLLIKVYVTMVRADQRWTGPEKRVAAVMIEYLWGHELRGQDLRDAATELFQQSDALSWPALVAPFVRYTPLANARARVETVVMRLANLVAKCDGQTIPEESEALHSLQHELSNALHPDDPLLVLPPHSIAGTLSAGMRGGESGNGDASRTSDSTGRQTTQTQARPLGTSSTRASATAENGTSSHRNATEVNDETEAESRQRRFDVAMTQLEELIGLDSVKQRIRSYANFLRLQKQRQQAGLNTMPISLHMTFVGNPGTGKTTVARIVGQLLGGMGTLASGHVVETDRSGLVAEYAGQTATKTNKICDSALDGILFVDEAYSLIDSSGDDAYGREAIQTLLKRMEDDRDRMAVILAGYRDEMQSMIRTNPGLSSRVNATIEFEDYAPQQLGEIFGLLCSQNQYRLPAGARHRLLIGFDELHRNRDRHFGNGRLVRNAFEDSVRRLADRVADVTHLSEELLTTLTADDVRMPGIPPSKLDNLIKQDHRLRRMCSDCGKTMSIASSSLGRRVRCPHCNTKQAAAWASVDRN